MVDLLLVRHGESIWNAVGRWQGQADPPLSEVGRRQAQLATRTLGLFDTVVSSSLQRAADTAAIIAEEMGIGPIAFDDRLVERDAGEWSGLTRVEIEEFYPQYLSTGRRPPGYEHDESLLERAREALGDLVVRIDSGTALVVCHGGIIYCLEAWLGASFDRIPNLGARWIHWSGDEPALGSRAMLVDPDDLTVQAPDLL